MHKDRCRWKALLSDGITLLWAKTWKQVKSHYKKFCAVITTAVLISNYIVLSDEDAIHSQLCTC